MTFNRNLATNLGLLRAANDAAASARAADLRSARRDYLAAQAAYHAALDRAVARRQDAAFQARLRRLAGH